MILRVLSPKFNFTSSSQLPLTSASPGTSQEFAPLLILAAILRMAQVLLFLSWSLNVNGPLIGLGASVGFGPSVGAEVGAAVGAAVGASVVAGAGGCVVGFLGAGGLVVAGGSVGALVGATVVATIVSFVGPAASAITPIRQTTAIATPKFIFVALF